MKIYFFTFFIYLIVTVCGAVAAPVLEAPLLPSKGAYFGAYLDWQHDSAAAFNKRLGMPAAVYVAFFHLPLGKNENNKLDKFIDQVAQQRGSALITLEPYEGLDVITPHFAAELAKRLAAYNKRGVPVFLRFAHEMNGYWYPWSQQPIEYVRAFRILATEIHKRTSQTAMLWAPNIGGSYPPESGGYLAVPGSYNFKLLDTNGDGRLDLLDDMYAPFYPGDDVVDWVGMSVYHWGNTYPWGENEIPEAHSFIDRITGNYVGKNGDERAVPDFYNVYVEQHGKPMAITETAALYNTEVGGDSEYLIKQAWWRQVFSKEVANQFSGIKMINWFETRKFESETNSKVDWSISFDPELTRLFLKDLPHQRLVFSDGLGKTKK